MLILNNINVVYTDMFHALYFQLPNLMHAVYLCMSVFYLLFASVI